jgi:hypothetical protein
MALQSNKETFAVVNLQNFTYATENWTHVWTMLIEADYASIISTKEVDARSPFATILQPRTDIKGSATPPSSGRFARKFAGGAGRRSQPGSRSPSRRSRFGSTGSQPEEPIIASIKEAAVMEDDMTQSTRLFRLKLERKSPDALATVCYPHNLLLLMFLASLYHVYSDSFVHRLKGRRGPQNGVWICLRSTSSTFLRL